MSGHSKWSKIKRAKGVTDQKRGSLFTKLARNITLSVKEGGKDPDMNFALRLAVDKAKVANMPANNIERAIKKGAGEGGGDVIERITYEAFAPGGVSLIIDCQTDNKNRSVAEVKNIVEELNGKFADIGSVAWKFDEKGLVLIEPAKLKVAEQFGKEDTYETVDSEEVQMELLDIEGVDDIFETDEKQIEIYTSKVKFAKVLKAVEQLKLKIISAELIKIAKEEVEIDDATKEKVGNLIEKLDDHDDVDSIWTDATID